MAANSTTTKRICYDDQAAKQRPSGQGGTYNNSTCPGFAARAFERCKSVLWRRPFLIVG